MLLEQFGGANGELAAAMQYSIQGLTEMFQEQLSALHATITRIEAEVIFGASQFTSPSFGDERRCC
jgi:hypothetical protein